MSQPVPQIPAVAVKIIRDAIQARSLCILTGAGVSKAVANLPLWGELLENGIRYAESNGIDAKRCDHARATLAYEPLQAGSTVRNLLSQSGGTLFQAWLTDEFGTRGHRTDHDLLRVLLEAHQADIGFRFATTNYDTIVDEILGLTALNWTSPAEDIDDFFTLGSPTVFHVHGIYNRSKSVIFSSEDYARHSGRYEATRDPLSRLLERYTVLFVGCGGTATDPHFSEVFSRVDRLDKVPKHVMLYPRPAGTQTPAPSHPEILMHPHGKFDDLPAVLRELLCLSQSAPTPSTSSTSTSTTSAASRLLPGPSTQLHHEPAQHSRPVIDLHLTDADLPFLIAGCRLGEVLRSALCLDRNSRAPESFHNRIIELVQSPVPIAALCDLPTLESALDALHIASFDFKLREHMQLRFERTTVFETQYLESVRQQYGDISAVKIHIGCAGYLLPLSAGVQYWREERLVEHVRKRLGEITEVAIDQQRLTEVLAEGRGKISSGRDILDRLQLVAPSA